MSHDPERELSTFEARTRALFEDSVANLDGRARSRLNQARQAALQTVRVSRAPLGIRAWAPLGGAAAIATLAVWMTLGQSGREGGLENGVPFDELELVADAPSFDLLEDVEFYAWIAAETRSNGNSG